MSARFKEDIAGLDINYGRIVVSHFALRHGQQVLDRLVVDEYDPAQSASGLSAQIRALWKKNKIPTRTVRACLHSRSLVLRYFQYTNISTDDVGQVLSLEAEEALQLPPDQIAMDWHLNPPRELVENGGVELSGILVAAPRPTVTRHLAILKSAGLYGVQVEPACCALNNLYTFITKDEPDLSICLINLADRTADIIMRSNIGYYPRSLFSAGEGWDDNTNYLLENIQNALLYHHLKAKQNPIQKIVLVGRIPQSDHFPEMLSKKASLPVDVMNFCSDDRLPRENISISQNHAKSCNLATGIGLGLRRFDS